MMAMVARRQMRQRGTDQRQQAKGGQRNPHGIRRPDCQPGGKDHGKDHQQEMRQRHVILRCLQYDASRRIGKGLALGFCSHNATKAV